MHITIPRWAQAVLIPVAIFLALYFAKVASHAVFVFLMSMVVALSPQRGRPGDGADQGASLGRGPGRLSGLRSPWWSSCSSSSARRSSASSSGCSRPSPAGSTTSTSLSPICRPGSPRTTSRSTCSSTPRTSSTGSRTTAARSVGTLFSVGVSVAGVFVNIFLTVVVSFYMLIDGKRIFRFLCRLAPGTPEVKEQYVRGLQTAFSRFVRGQALLAATIGLACGLAIWILSWDDRRRLAGGRPVCPALRLLGGHHRGHPLRGTVDRGGAAGHRRVLPLPHRRAGRDHRLLRHPAVGEPHPRARTSWAARWGCTRSS